MNLIVCSTNFAEPYWDFRWSVLRNRLPQKRPVDLTPGRPGTTSLSTLWPRRRLLRKKLQDGELSWLESSPSWIPS